MCQPDEDVLAWTFQPLTMILDEAQEALYVRILIKVNRQYVPHIVWSTATLRSPVAGIPEEAFGRIKRIETAEGPPQYYRVGARSVHVENCNPSIGRLAVICRNVLDDSTLKGK